MLDPVGYHSIECGSQSHGFAGGVAETWACCACRHQEACCGRWLDELGWAVVLSVMRHHSIDIYGLQTHVGPCGVPFYRVWVTVALLCRRCHRDLSLLCLLMVIRRYQILRHAAGVDGFRVLWVNWDVCDRFYMLSHVYIYRLLMVIAYACLCCNFFYLKWNFRTTHASIAMWPFWVESWEPLHSGNKVLRICTGSTQ